MKTTPTNDVSFKKIMQTSASNSHGPFFMYFAFQTIDLEIEN